jgi:hypothetical protein
MLRTSVCGIWRRSTVADKRDSQIRLVYGEATEADLETIQRYYLEVDGMWLSKSEVFRRSAMILANEIKKSEEKAKGVR